jgi:hypothetical protein
MFANMAIDSTNRHLVFKYAPTMPMKLLALQTNTLSGPLVSSRGIDNEFATENDNLISPQKSRLPHDSEYSSQKELGTRVHLRPDEEDP